MRVYFNTDKVDPKEHKAAVIKLFMVSIILILVAVYQGGTL